MDESLGSAEKRVRDNLQWVDGMTFRRGHKSNMIYAIITSTKVPTKFVMRQLSVDRNSTNQYIWGMGHWSLPLTKDEIQIVISVS